MSNIKIDNKLIQDIAKKIDKAGNNNNVIDGNEVSIFVDELKGKGVSDAQQIINSYETNKLYYENRFTVKNLTYKDNYKNAIMAQLNANSALNKNYKARNDVQMVINGIKKAVDPYKFWWGTDEEKLKANVGMINKDNVINILNAKYNDDETMIQAIDGDVDGKVQEDAFKTILEALIAAADEKQIDITDIVIKDEKGYKAGSAIEDVEFGSDALSSANFEKIANAIKDRINSSLESVTNPDKAKEDPKAAMLLLAKQADSAVNGGDENGYINGEEIVKFKAACARIGISINGIISSIYKKTENKGELSENEKTVKTLFDKNTNIASTMQAESLLRYQKNVIKKAIKDKDEGELKEYLSPEKVTSENVMALLKDFENIGTEIHKAFSDDDAEEFVKVIITALYNKADEENIDVADIIRPAGDIFLTTNGENALDSKYSNEVIQQLKAKIEEEAGE